MQRAVLRPHQKSLGATLGLGDDGHLGKEPADIGIDVAGAEHRVQRDNRHEPEGEPQGRDPQRTTNRRPGRAVVAHRRANSRPGRPSLRRSRARRRGATPEVLSPSTVETAPPDAVPVHRRQCFSAVAWPCARCGICSTDAGPAYSGASTAGGCQIPESISAICRSTTDTTKRENGLR
jgi:hypothetical protein